VSSAMDTLKLKNSIYSFICRVVLKTLPKLLIIQLKRFKITQYGLRKATYCINIPKELRMDYLLEKTEKELNNDNSYFYSLNSIVVHVGQGSEYGHYYSLLKISDKWFKYDDEKINVTKLLIK
jgi:ubiquitin C-terminal hydrolase